MKDIIIKQAKSTDNRIFKIIRDWILDKSDYNMEFYGEFNLGINFYESINIPTAGVNVTRDGFNFYYNKKFIDSLTDKQLAFLIIHENYHLLFEHSSRTLGIGADPQISNIAQDLIINKIIDDKIPHSIAKIILDENNEKNGLFLPPEYVGQELYEEVYVWLLNQKLEVDKELDRMIQNFIDNDKKNIEQKQHSGNNKNNNKSCGMGDWKDRFNGELQFKNDPYFDDTNVSEDMNNVRRALANRDAYIFDVHLDDDVPEEIKRELIKNKLQEIKNRGLFRGDMEEIIGRLRKKKRDYLKAIKRGISLIKGNIKSSTYARPNRRGFINLKGKKKYAQIINCIMDTSGSMGGHFNRAFDFIFQNNIEINLIQIDTEVRDVKRIINKNDLQKVIIKGLGGTELQPAINRIKSDSKLNKYNTLILTDGYTDKLNVSGLGRVLIISNDKECPLVNNKGVQQIVIKDFEE